MDTLDRDTIKAEIGPLISAWISGNMTAQQFPDEGAYQIADMLGHERRTDLWQWAMRGAAEFKVNGLAYTE